MIKGKYAAAVGGKCPKDRKRRRMLKSMKSLLKTVRDTKNMRGERKRKEISNDTH